MKKHLLLGFFLLFSATIFAQDFPTKEKIQSLTPVPPPTFGGEGEFIDRPAYYSNRFYVKYTNQNVLKKYSGESPDQLQNIMERSVIASTLKEKKAIEVKSLQEFSRRPFKSLENVVEITFEEDLTAAEIHALSQSAEVALIERVPVWYIHDEVVVNDPLLTNQYAMELTGALKSFPLLSGGEKIKLAIVDDAVFIDHEDLAANVDFAGSVDVADNDDNPNPPASGVNAAGPMRFSHGTHCAGIAAAVTNNATGIAGISNNFVEIIGIKATRDNTPNTRSIEQGFLGVQTAVSNGAKIVSMSYGGPGSSTVQQNFFTEATLNQGVLFISSAGNGNTDVRGFPAAYDNVMAVANTTAADVRNGSSHYGEWVDIAAPGTLIFSTVANANGGILESQYANMTGTSMSGPMVAGLAALIWSQEVSLSPVEVADLIKDFSTPIDALNPGFEGLLGAGRINAYNSMLAVLGIDGVPSARIGASLSTAFVGQPVNFASLSEGINLSYSWDFGPAASVTSSTNANQTLTFTEAGVYEISLQVSNAGGTDEATITITVVGGEDCDTPGFALEQRASTVAWGGNQSNPIAGHNIFTEGAGDLAFATRFSYTPNVVLTGGLFSFNRANSNAPEDELVHFVVYDANGPGQSPGNVLTRRSIPYSEIKLTTIDDGFDREDFFEVVFDEPINIPSSGEIFMGFEVIYGNGNDLRHNTFSIGSGDGNRFAIQQSNGSWTTVGARTGGANIQMEMYPIFTNENNVVVGEIQNSLEVETACLADTETGLVFSFQEADNNNLGTQYFWTFEGADISESTELNPEVSFSEPGTFAVELLVSLANCEDAFQRFTYSIEVVDCGEAPIADFEVSAPSIRAGGSINFTNKSENATAFEWEFIGGDPETSTDRDVTVTYSTPGVYSVSLKSANPVGAEDELLKEDFITVLESTDDCGLVLFDLLNPFMTNGVGANGGGFLSGHNPFSIDRYVNRFTVDAGEFISGGSIQVASAVSSAPASSRITVELYSGTADAPQNLLRSKQVSFVELQNAIANNQGFVEVFFDAAVEAEEGVSYFFGIAIENFGPAFNASQESMHLRSTNTSNGQGLGFIRFNGAWNAFANLNLNIAFAAYPSVSASEPISAAFTINGQVANNLDVLRFDLNEDLSLAAIEDLDGLIYEWSVSNAVINDRFDTAPTVTLDRLGRKEITLRVEGTCDKSVSVFTVFVDIIGENISADLMVSPEPNLPNDQYAVNTVITLDASASDDFTDFEWDGPQWFLDQVDETSLVQEITLSEVGDFEVSLKLTSGTFEDEAILSLSIDGDPFASFLIEEGFTVPSLNAFAQGLSITIDATASANFDEFSWDGPSWLIEQLGSISEPQVVELTEDGEVDLTLTVEKNGETDVFSLSFVVISSEGLAIICDTDPQGAYTFNGQWVLGDGSGGQDLAVDRNLSAAQYLLNITRNEVGELVFSDITAGLYRLGYEERDNPGIGSLDCGVITITNQPDVVYGGDVFNGGADIIFDEAFNLVNLQYDVSNNFGDGASGVFTPYILANISTDIEVAEQDLAFNQEITLDGAGSIGFTSYQWDGPTWVMDQINDQNNPIDPTIILNEIGEEFTITLKVFIRNLESETSFTFSVNPLSIESVGTLEPLEVTFGTEFSALALPEMVSVELS
ncbi:MAG: S8 family serine peptidase, partial [Cyclobacteriaceae bacterium]|nr:S8 family serine peptidase [Cyclobacteriaceae bacterium]